MVKYTGENQTLDIIWINLNIRIKWIYHENIIQ
jgi:hypothetical protein